MSTEPGVPDPPGRGEADPADPRASEERANAPSPGISARTPARSGRSVPGAPDSGAESTHMVQVVGVRAVIPARGTREQRVASIAAAQRGVVTRAQLRQAAISDTSIDRMVLRGTLRRLHRGVFALGEIRSTPLARETAALLACRDGAVLSHATAAVIWELPVRPPDAVHILVAGRQTGRPAGVMVHRTSDLSAKDIRHRHGLPLTSPARTLLDLADTLTARPLERALDEALAKRLVRRSQLHELLARAHGRHGAGALTALLDPKRPTSRTVSRPEERFLALVRQARLPEPETNAPFLDFDVDVLWREHRLAVEIDSYDYHSAPRKFQRDRAKGNAIIRAGFILLRPTPEQIDDDGLALIATVAETLARAA